MLQNPGMNQAWMNSVNAFMAAQPTWPVYDFVYNLAITLALGGVADRTINTAALVSGSLSGLLMTDAIIELQVAGDLPSGFCVGQQRISANGELKIRFLSPVAVVLSSTPVTFKLRTKRG